MNTAEYRRLYDLNYKVKPVSLKTALRLSFGDSMPDGTLLYSEVGLHGLVRHLFIKNGECYFEDCGKKPEVVCLSTELKTFYNQGYLRLEFCSFAFCEAIILLTGKELFFTPFKPVANDFAPYAKDVSAV